MAQNTPISLLGQRHPTVPHPLLALPTGGQRPPVRSLYVHVPFCFHKCHYCDFYSIVDTRDRQNAFTDRLIGELQALARFAEGAPLRTIFVGGGTPSLLRVDLWERLLKALHQAFDLSLVCAAAGQPGLPPEAAAEFTVECNPETVSPELMAVLRAGGVGRVSVGAQSFNRAHLATLERWHNPENVPRALELAASAGIARRSLDLIFAIPGQTLDEWTADLRAGIALSTEHISCYNLTYEKGTAMTARRDRGHFSPVDEDLEVDMYEATLAITRAAGFDRYEVSNYARPGAASVHNLAYWRQETWLAAGPSASGHVAGWRWKNAPRLDDYLADSGSPLPPAVDVEPPDARRALCERLMTGLRISEGLDAGSVLDAASQISPALREKLASLAGRLEAGGLLRTEPGRWASTDAGMMIADATASRFMAAINAG